MYIYVYVFILHIVIIKKYMYFYMLLSLPNYKHFQHCCVVLQIIIFQHCISSP